MKRTLLALAIILSLSACAFESPYHSDKPVVTKSHDNEKRMEGPVKNTIRIGGQDGAVFHYVGDFGIVIRDFPSPMLGTVKVAKAFLPAMIETRSGKIVNVASDAGRVGSSGETIYAGAKGGVIAFTKSLAREMAPHGLCVNCVCPGPTDTPLFRSLPDKLQAALTRAIPFRRLARPEEIADAILFFASPRSDFITGQILSVSGGLTMAG